MKLSLGSKFTTTGLLSKYDVNSHFRTYNHYTIVDIIIPAKKLPDFYNNQSLQRRFGYSSA